MCVYVCILHLYRYITHSELLHVCRYFSYDPIRHKDKEGYSPSQGVKPEVKFSKGPVVQNFTSHLTNLVRLRGYSYNSFHAKTLVEEANKPEMSPARKEGLLARVSEITFSFIEHACLFTLPLERSRVLVSDLWTL
jgi:hypothetical protein